MREDGRQWSRSYARQVRARLEGDAYPRLGALPISGVTPADILAVLDLVAARSPTQAKLVKTWIGGVFRYAVKRLVCAFDPTWPLRRSVRTPQVRHHPAIPPEQAWRIPPCNRCDPGYGGGTRGAARSDANRTSGE